MIRDSRRSGKQARIIVLSALARIARVLCSPAQECKVRDEAQRCLRDAEWARKLQFTNEVETYEVVTNVDAETEA